MILLDCGNRQLKAQFRDSEMLRASFACSYRHNWITRLARWLQEMPAQACYLASVLDAGRQQQLDACLAQRFGTAVTRFVSEPGALGVKNGYQQPERLGVDRWMTLVAAPGIVPGDALIIDAGSAITLDLLRADGQHLGGAILPGFNTTLDDFKRIFSYIDFSDPVIAETTQPGGSTEAAIQIDYAQSTSEYLTGLVNRWTSHFENQATLLLAGGDAARVQRVLDRPCRILPDLVFRGIYRLATQ